ncbi:MAG: hypothetical protein ACKESB_03860 [Candidatus Hodgkinia cicadicola]
MPFDPLPADLTSGLRLGSCAVATAAGIVADVIRVKADSGFVSRELEASARADVMLLGFNATADGV